MPNEVASLLEPVLRPEPHCYFGCLRQRRFASQSRWYHESFPELAASVVPGLKSLSLRNVQIPQPYLERTLTLAPRLRELRLIQLRLDMVCMSTVHTVTFNTDPFLKHLDGLDLCLQFFHFSLHGTDTTKEELENRWRLFGRCNIINGWGLNVDTANALLPQNIFQIPNVVTALELYHGGIGTSEVVVRRLHRFLCDLPCLLYLRVEHVVVFTHVMMSTSATLPTSPRKRLNNYGRAET